MPRPIRATISASALARNLEVARAHAGSARVWAVLKAGGYGHGLQRCARALAHADGFAILDVSEAIALRAEGVRKPILMLEGFFQASDIPLLAEHRITPVIHNIEQIEMLEKTRLEGQVDAYLKVNSGMNRLGFTVENVRLAWNALGAHPGIGAVTLMTHFADADGESGVAAQLQWFNELTQPFEGERCMANSAALLRFAEQTRGDWVRPGIMLYGCSPFPFKSAQELGLLPAMTLGSEIIAV